MGLFDRFRKREPASVPEPHAPVTERRDLVDSQNTDRYYALFDSIELARRASDVDRVLELSMQGVALVPSLVRETKREFGKFDLSGIPPVEYVCRFAPIRQDRSLLERTRAVIEPFPELEYWVGFVDEAIERVDLTARLLELVRSNPGFLQKDLGPTLGVHGRITAGLVRDLMLDEQLKGERGGKTWRLEVVPSTGEI